MQINPAKITVSSDAADVELRNVRIYDRALSDDEMLSNHIVDRTTADEMVILFRKNDILNDEDAVDIDKLRAQGKGCMRIVGDVDLVNQTNNKKFEVTVDIYFYSPYGKEYDFVARNVHTTPAAFVLLTTFSAVVVGSHLRKQPIKVTTMCAWALTVSR